MHAVAIEVSYCLGRVENPARCCFCYEKICVTEFTDGWTLSILHQIFGVLRTLEMLEPVNGF